MGRHDDTPQGGAGVKNYEKPEVTDLGDLQEMTAAMLQGPYYDCNARPGQLINPLDQGSTQNPVCP
jgi:hypothetical protein